MKTDFNAFKNENIFQDFYELILKYKTLGRFQNVNLSKISKVLNEIEKQLERTLFKTDKYWNTNFYFIVNRTLSKYYSIFRLKGFKIDVTYASFNKYLQFLKFLAFNSQNLESTEEQTENFYKIIPLSEFEYEIDDELEFEVAPPEEYQSIEKFERIIANFMGIKIDGADKITYQKGKSNNLRIFCDNYKAKIIKWDNRKQQFSVISEEYYLNLGFIYYKNNKPIPNPEEFALSLYLILSSFKFIKNTKVEILDFSKGSIRSFFRVWLDGKTAKNETIKLLEDAKDSASNENIKDSNLKKSKTKSLSNQGNDAINELSNKDRIALERENLKNENLRLKNLNLQLQIMQKATDLFKQGLLTPESLEVIVNSRIYFVKDGNNTIGFRSNLNDIPD